MSAIYDVAIIGCGPTGAVLANLLGQRGLRVVVLEKQPAPYGLPRAVHIDGECMRILQWCGVADQVLPDLMVGQGMLFKDPDGHVVVDWSRNQQIGPQGWHESYRCHQPALEGHLRDGLSRIDCVDLRMGAEVVSLEQGSAGVRVTMADGAHLQARYVIGCDGAGSRTRELIEAEQDDLGFEERWLVIDLIIRGAAADLGDHTIQFCDPDQPATYVRGVWDRRRWELRLDAGDLGPADESQVWERLRGRVSADDATLERHAVYTFRSRVARDWRRGRMLLAGDAAHQMPPFMG